MKINMFANIGSTTATEIQTTALEVNNLYGVLVPTIDDETGVTVWGVDMAWCFVDTIPGQGTKMHKLFRFITTGRTKKLSELIGVKFHGPYRLAVLENTPLEQEVEDRAEQLDRVLAQVDMDERNRE